MLTERLNQRMIMTKVLIHAVLDLAKTGRVIATPEHERILEACR
ncbi:MAG: hypothetical protein ETSY1_18935 [Candidatus Entotheonella factor]|uniref:Uncharacterized protein n=1 Tax=Entotheonella factor TaxID=1429438 RepID=W4LKH3_ENTF1|nr:MAG: hypothetical protein ETSY1_18935 [Candidatus Entotheonella factor]